MRKVAAAVVLGAVLVLVAVLLTSSPADVETPCLRPAAMRVKPSWPAPPPIAEAGVEVVVSEVPPGATCAPSNSAKCVVAAPLPGAATKSAGEIRACQMINALALDLYAQLKEQEGNFVCSPYEIETALAMTYAGARGHTARQFARLLHAPTRAFPAHFIHPAMRILACQLCEQAANGDYHLVASAALWLRRGRDFPNEFLASLNTTYCPEVDELDFVQPHDAARRIINRWTEARTDRSIADVIPPGILDDRTTLVLSRAICFRGAWAAPFDPKRTRESGFTLESGETVRAAMMQQDGHYGYARSADGEVELLEVPYSAQAFSMVILLPDRDKGMAALDQALSVEHLGQWLSRLEKADMRLEVPRFTVRSSLDLKLPLEALGLKAARGASPDFSGINGKKNLFVKSVLHKALLTVNEQGTEGPASAGAESGGDRRPLRVFRADRSFLLLIRDNQTGCILFLGRVMDPRPAAEGRA